MADEDKEVKMSQQRPAQTQAAGRRLNSPKVLHFSAPHSQEFATGNELMMRMNINITHTVYQMLFRAFYHVNSTLTTIL